MGSVQSSSVHSPEPLQDYLFGQLCRKPLSDFPAGNDMLLFPTDCLNFLAPKHFFPEGATLLGSNWEEGLDLLSPAKAPKSDWL